MTSNIHEFLEKKKNEFLINPHSTKKHRPESAAIFKQIAKESSESRVDKWKSLYEYKSQNGVCGNDIMSALRDHLSELQNERCCYCRRLLMNIAYARPVDHILSRKSYPQFSLEYNNLALSCYDCNLKKTGNDWADIQKSTIEYPDFSQQNDFYHPRFNNYDDHIKYLRIETNGISFIVYIGLTKNGKHLCENLLAMISAQESYDSGNKDFANDMMIIKSHEKTLLNSIPAIEEFYKATYKRILDSI